MNIYRRGSWFHKVFQRLLAHPGKWWTMASLFRGIGFQDQERMIAIMKGHGTTGERGYKFVIERVGYRVRFMP